MSPVAYGYSAQHKQHLSFLRFCIRREKQLFSQLHRPAGEPWAPVSGPRELILDMVPQMHPQLLPIYPTCRQSSCLCSSQGATSACIHLLPAAPELGFRPWEGGTSLIPFPCPLPARCALPAQLHCGSNPVHTHTPAHRCVMEQMYLVLHHDVFTRGCPNSPSMPASLSSPHALLQGLLLCPL